MELQQPASNFQPDNEPPAELSTGLHNESGEGRGQQRSEFGVFFFVGALLSLFGLSLALAPEFSWQLTKIGRALAAAGIESGTLIVGGLVFAGLGQVARQKPTAVAAVPTPEPLDANNELRFISDQLVTQLSHLQTSTLQIAEDVAGISEVQKSFFLKLDGKDDLAEEHRDALFRLAASLDKLNAHFDERIHAIDLQVRSGLDGLIQAIGQTRQHLERHIDASASKFSAKMSPPTSASSSPSEELHVLVELEEPSESGPESEDFFGTSLERLDEISRGLGGGGNNPPPAIPSEGGALDTVQPPHPPEPGA